ncbi:transposase [Myxococcus sp. MISCRS1]|nr:transposase [Myxococcus sp. MISCRS1]MCY0998106.1 transposase [Myxococcus sp. MISCRS1]
MTKRCESGWRGHWKPRCRNWRPWWTTRGFRRRGSTRWGGRQSSGTLGRTDNCQVAVSLHLAGRRGSGCIGMRLYLPEDRVTDTVRRKAVGVPETVGAARKWELALGPPGTAPHLPVKKGASRGALGRASSPTAARCRSRAG